MPLTKQHGARVPFQWRGTAPRSFRDDRFLLHAVLPFTTKSQPDNSPAYPIASPLDGLRAWVVCDCLTTVAVSRLHTPGQVVPRVERTDFNRVVALVLQGLPRPDCRHPDSSCYVTCHIRRGSARVRCPPRRELDAKGWCCHPFRFLSKRMASLGGGFQSCNPCTLSPPPTQCQRWSERVASNAAKCAHLSRDKQPSGS